MCYLLGIREVLYFLVFGGGELLRGPARQLSRTWRFRKLGGIVGFCHLLMLLGKTMHASLEMIINSLFSIRCGPSSLSRLRPNTQKFAVTLSLATTEECQNLRSPQRRFNAMGFILDQNHELGRMTALNTSCLHGDHQTSYS